MAWAWGWRLAAIHGWWIALGAGLFVIRNFRSGHSATNISRSELTVPH